MVVVLPVIAGCTPNLGNIQRNARVPHPGVPLSAGQPLDTPAELSAGLSNVTDVIKPGVGNETQAVEVPSIQMRDELRLRLGQRAQLALIYEQGFAGTSHQPDATQAPVGPGDVRGYGASIGYSFATSTPGFSIGTTFEVMGWSVPYVEYRTCLGCPTTILHGRTVPMTLGLGFAPSYRHGRLTYFGGVFLRNHPTIERKSIDVDLPEEPVGDVQSGPFNLLLNAGVEVELDHWLTALVVIHQDVVADPVRYGPGIGIALTARLGS